MKLQTSLAECCHRERVSLLAYSPLAMVRRPRSYARMYRLVALPFGDQRVRARLNPFRACSPANTSLLAARRPWRG